MWFDKIAYAQFSLVYKMKKSSTVMTHSGLVQYCPYWMSNPMDFPVAHPLTHLCIVATGARLTGCSTGLWCPHGFKRPTR